MYPDTDFEEDPSSEVCGKSRYQGLLSRGGPAWLLALLRDRSLCGDYLYYSEEFALECIGCWRLGVPIKQRPVNPVLMAVTLEEEK